MPFPPNRSVPPGRPGRDLDPALRELLVYLRDTFREAAARIDRYVGGGTSIAPPARGDWRERDVSDEEHDDYGNAIPRPRPSLRAPPSGGSGTEKGTRMPLEALREEARQISAQAPDMDPAELRLRVEAVTAETRSLQNRATDPEDKDIAAKILRALTAIVSEYRPGHVYGLARHHEADWDEVGRRAREELAGRGGSE